MEEKKSRFTPEIIAKYKKEFDKVYRYTTVDGKECLLKNPTLQILDACRAISGGSHIKFDDALLQNCWIDGDLEIKTVDAYKLGIFDFLGGLIHKIAGNMEEL